MVVLHGAAHAVLHTDTLVHALTPNTNTDFVF